MIRRLTARAEDAGLRLDVWLDRCLPDLSRSRLQALIRSGHVCSAGEALVAHRHVQPGLEVTVEVPPPVPAEAAAEDIPLDVLHEDADLIVINKPAGLVVHPAAGHASGTLVNALLHRCRDLQGVGGVLRPGIVHRLDKDTSGVMVAAKTEAAHDGLVEQFKAGSVRKLYRALVYGRPVPASGTVETLIGRSTQDRKKMSARPRTGRRAVTHYEAEAMFDAFALLKVRIETGRTHQIRVHLAHIGHPVVGDRQYGHRPRRPLPADVTRQMLHAALLQFRHPVSGAALVFTAPLAPDMAGLLGALGWGGALDIGTASPDTEAGP